MAIDLHITNFKNIRSLRLVDENPMSVVVGLNESGKSSLLGAVRWCFTGRAFGRVGKETDGLMTWGEDHFGCRVLIGNTLVSRTRTGGTPLKSVAQTLGVSGDVLPLMFDSELCGDGGSKAMKTFLDGAAANAFDALAHFAADLQIRECILLAKGAGKTTTRQILQYCEDMRAMQKAPPEPVLPVTPAPKADELEITAVALQQAEEAATAALQTLNEATSLSNSLSQLQQYRQAMETYSKQVAAASVTDELAGRRQAITRAANINISTLTNLRSIVQEAGYEQTASNVAAVESEVKTVAGECSAILRARAAPAAMPTVTPTLPAAIEALAVSLELTVLPAEPDALPTFLAGSLAELATARQEYDKAIRAKQDVQNTLATLNQRLGAWKAYTEALPAWETAKAYAEAQWQRWDLAHKAIVAAENEHVNKAGDAFGELVSEFSSSILQGRKVRVSREDGILLGSARIEDVSKSTRWRVEIAVLAAVAALTKSPILLIDGADILDVNNRKLVTEFLTNHVVPRFQHTIVTLTPTGDLSAEKPLPVEFRGVTKWKMDRGELSKV